MGCIVHAESKFSEEPENPGFALLSGRANRCQGWCDRVVFRRHLILTATKGLLCLRCYARHIFMIFCMLVKLDKR